MSVYDDREPIHEPAGVLLLQQEQQLGVGNDGVVVQLDNRLFVPSHNCLQEFEHSHVDQDLARIHGQLLHHGRAKGENSLVFVRSV